MDTANDIKVAAQINAVAQIVSAYIKSGCSVHPEALPELVASVADAIKNQFK